MTTEQRARVFDILSLLREATTWFGLNLVNSDPASLSWSGLAREKWSEHTAEYAKGRHDALLGKLEKWVEDDVRRGERSLVGAGAEGTVADFFLLAVVEYTAVASGRDWIEGHKVLGEWCERAKVEKWWVGIEGLAGMERDGLKVCGVDV